MTIKAKDGCLPLLVYSDPYDPPLRKDRQGKPIPEDQLVVPPREDYFTNIFGLFRFKDTRNWEHTLQISMTIDDWYNFCGGQMFYAPSVKVFRVTGVTATHDHGWGAPQRAFMYNGGHYWSRSSLPITIEGYDHFREGIPDLNHIFQEEQISVEDAEALGWNSLVGTMKGMAFTTNRRFWVGADRDSAVADGHRGHITKLMNVLKTHKLSYVYDRPLYITGSIGSYPQKPFDGICIQMPYGTGILNADITETKGLNWNTSGACTAYTVLFGPENMDRYNKKKLEGDGGTKDFEIDPADYDITEKCRNRLILVTCPNRLCQGYNTERPGIAIWDNPNVPLEERHIIVGCQICRKEIKEYKEAKPEKKVVDKKSSHMWKTVKYVKGLVSNPLYLDLVPWTRFYN